LFVRLVTFLVCMDLALVSLFSRFLISCGL